MDCDYSIFLDECGEVAEEQFGIPHISPEIGNTRPMKNPNHISPYLPSSNLDMFFFAGLNTFDDLCLFGLSSNRRADIQQISSRLLTESFSEKSIDVTNSLIKIRNTLDISLSLPVDMVGHVWLKSSLHLKNSIEQILTSREVHQNCLIGMAYGEDFLKESYRIVGIIESDSWSKKVFIPDPLEVFNKAKILHYLKTKFISRAVSVNIPLSDIDILTNYLEELNLNQIHNLIYPMKSRGLYGDETDTGKYVSKEQIVSIYDAALNRFKSKSIQAIYDDEETKQTKESNQRLIEHIESNMLFGDY